MDSPDQGAKGIPVNNTSFENSILKIEITNAGIKYKGTLNKENIIIGNFKQAGQCFLMNLTKENTKKNKIIKAPIKDIMNFVEENIILQTKTGKIYGTLTTSKKIKKVPLVLIIPGSGPTDRDCNNSMMKCNAYKKLAYRLAKNNIASLRYDKRGIAKSKSSGRSESKLRFEDYVNDVKKWILLIKQDKRFSKVIILGHSEGSLIGMLAARNADKFISIAGLGQTADKAIKAQLSTQPKIVQELSYPIIDSLVNGETVDKVPPMLSSLFRRSVQPYIISWFKYDPQIEIQKITIPILLIQGTNDIQVSIKDTKLLSNANPNAQVVLINEMNHIFRIVKGDKQANLATYNNPLLSLSDELVKNITSFILNN
jgi:pimeloyl-ACP methyl ester carboxylesterase